MDGVDDDVGGCGWVCLITGAEAVCEGGGGGGGCLKEDVEEEGGGGGGRRFDGRLSCEVFIFEGMVLKLSLEVDLCVDEPLEPGLLVADVDGVPREGSSFADFLDCLVESFEGLDP